MQRYEWEDSLIQAQADGLINDTALLVALKLSKAINWAPKKRAVPGLYWANEDAAQAVGIKRASLYRGLKTLKEQGFFELVNGNLVPTLPKSQIETPKSQIDTSKSQIETAESQIDNPFTVDIFTDDSFTVDLTSCSVSADAPTAQQTLTKEGEDMEPSSDSKTKASTSLDSKTDAAPEPEASLDSKTDAAASDSKGEFRQSQSETNWLNFKEPKTESCQHDRIGFCRKCDTADLADLQDAVSLL